MKAEGPFAERVAEGMRAKGYTLRHFCRTAGLDPSFFSKVLSGKRSPPAEEGVLRRIAELLELDPAELVVAAGRIPSEWRSLWDDPELFREVHGMASGGRVARRGGERPIPMNERKGQSHSGRQRTVPAAIRKSVGGRGHIEEELL